jgi:CRISPR-associated protein Csm1
VYAGGDDLLLIGPRSRTLALAGEIRGAFVRYAQHPEVTLSAGLAVVKPKLPLAHTVKQSDAALDRAKEAGRDRLSVLGQTFPWVELAPLIGEIGKLIECRPASGFLYHLMACADLWRQFHHDHFVPGLRYHALLAYYLARNVNARQQPALYEWTARLLQFPPRGEIERLLDRLPLVAQWVLLERREH